MADSEPSTALKRVSIAGLEPPERHSIADGHPERRSLADLQHERRSMSRMPAGGTARMSLMSDKCRASMGDPTFDSPVATPRMSMNDCGRTLTPRRMSMSGAVVDLSSLVATVQFQAESRAPQNSETEPSGQMQHLMRTHHSSFHDLNSINAPSRNSLTPSLASVAAARVSGVWRKLFPRFEDFVERHYVRHKSRALPRAVCSAALFSTLVASAEFYMLRDFLFDEAYEGTLLREAAELEAWYQLLLLPAVTWLLWMLLSGCFPLRLVAACCGAVVHGCCCCCGLCGRGALTTPPEPKTSSSREGGSSTGHARHTTTTSSSSHGTPITSPACRGTASSSSSSRRTRMTSTADETSEGRARRFRMSVSRRASRPGRASAVEAGSAAGSAAAVAGVAGVASGTATAAAGRGLALVGSEVAIPTEASDVAPPPGDALGREGDGDGDGGGDGDGDGGGDGDGDGGGERKEEEEEEEERYEEDDGWEGGELEEEAPGLLRRLTVDHSDTLVFAVGVVYTTVLSFAPTRLLAALGRGTFGAGAHARAPFRCLCPFPCSVGWFCPYLAMQVLMPPLAHARARAPCRRSCSPTTLPSRAATAPATATAQTARTAAAAWTATASGWA